MLKSKSINFQNVNFQNLLAISKILYKIEHFICYGTLLGMTRNKNHQNSKITLIKATLFKNMRYSKDDYL